MPLTPSTAPCLQVRGERYTPRDTVTAIEPGRMREANMRLVEEFGSQVGVTPQALQPLAAGWCPAGTAAAGCRLQPEART